MKTTRILTMLLTLAGLIGHQHAHAQWGVNGDDIYNLNSGNVGIGTDTPDFKLDVQRFGNPQIQVKNTGGNAGATFRMVDQLSGADFSFKSTTTGGFKIRDNAYAMDVLFIESNSAPNALYIDSEGNIGLGTTGPAQKLHVIGNAYVTGAASIAGTNIQSGDFIANALNGVINCGGGFNSNANVISDDLTPAISFAVGDEDLYIQDALEVVGNAYKTGGGSWSTLSDQRYKKNIEPFGDGLSQLLQINPVSFQYNDMVYVADHEKRYIGILAQDMLDIAPYMVEELPMGQVVREIENGVDEILEQGELVYTFDPSALDYLLINSVKQQQDIIQGQDQRIHDLEKENEMIRNELQNLRSAIEELQK